MKFVNANAKYVSMDGDPIEFIERVGRTCYKSEDKIEDGTADKFVERLAASGHYAMLEFGYIYLKASKRLLKAIRGFIYPKYNEDILLTTSRQNYFHIVNNYITGSFRAFLDMFAEMSIPCDEVDALYELLAALCEKYPNVFTWKELPCQTKKSDYLDSGYYEPVALIFDNRDDYIEDVKQNCIKVVSDTVFYNTLPHSVLFTVDRGITHELVRHRPCSFAMESTRYCSYDKGKFGSEITVVKPCFLEESTSDPKWVAWKSAMCACEAMYMTMLKEGSTAQEARSVLPNSLKADLWMCAVEREWQHILNLRLAGKTGKPHPQMVEVMEQLEPQISEATNRRVHLYKWSDSND